MKKALFAAGGFWDSPYQGGCHKIAKVLLDLGWEIGFLSSPISPFHVLGGITQELKNRFNLYKSGGKRLYDGALWTYVPCAFMTPYNKPILSSRYIFENWQSYAFPNVLKKVREAGFAKVDLLYIDTNVLFFFLEKIDYDVSIFRIVDLNKEDINLSPVIHEKELETARKVDYVAYTAHNLEKYIATMQGLKNKPIYFPNGVEYKHFQNALGPLPLEYSSLKGPIAIYVGRIDFWFDYELMRYLAKQRPDINFVVIGDMNKADQKFDGINNIYCLGARSHDIISDYIKHADVGLVPFDRKSHTDFIDSINPLKLYEYMACGLPVVAQEWEELKFIDSPAYLYRDKEECLAYLDKAIAEGGAHKDVYKAYAKAQSWDIRVKDMLKSIGMLEG